MKNIKIDPLIIRIEGTGGAGGSSAAEVLARAAARAGYYMQCSRAFPAEIKGGRAWFQIKLSSRPVTWWGGAAHFDITDTRNGDWIVEYRPAASESYKAAFSPRSISKEQGGSRNANLVLLGFMAATLNLELSIVVDAAKQRYGKRGGSDDELKSIIEEGYKAHHSESDWYVWDIPQPKSNGRRLVLNGNEAISLGALAAGVQFFCGYPITPASSILEFMLKELPNFGGTAIQMEDEISAMGACLGASYAGKKAMAATSGPGFALMSEMLNLAVMAELPITIVDVQRSGPATGQPSKSEQADLLYALYGSPGDVQRLVLAPNSIEDAIYTTIEAVNLSEQYQMPVIVLSDAALANCIEAIPEPDWDSIQRINRQRPTATNVADFERYIATLSGVSAMAIPGEDDLPYIASGMEHHSSGKPAGELANHYEMTDKRMKKVESARKTLHQNQPLVLPEQKSTIGIIGWGSTSGAIEEARNRLSMEDVQVTTLNVRYLNPLPEEQIKSWLDNQMIVFVVEDNRSAQFARLIRHLAPDKLISVLPEEYEGSTPEQIVSVVRELHTGKRLEEMHTQMALA